MHWIVVYDFATQWFDPLFLLPVLACSGMGFMAYVMMRENDVFGSWNWLRLIAASIIPGLFMWGFLKGTIADYQRLSHAYSARTYQVVEGVVENFRVVCNGHGGESFDVDGVEFGYGMTIELGYTQMSCSGGPMRNGVYVRIWYVEEPGGGRTIIRLETRV